MEFILKAKPNARRHFLIYGKKYRIYRNGNFLGIATYEDDDIHGDVFIIPVLINGKVCKEVACVDECVFAE
jgi:hypothetical protein